MIEVSDKRCHRCSKGMMREPDPYYTGAGTRWLYDCWDCGWRTTAVEPSKPELKVIAGGQSGAERLKRVRLGDAPHSA